MSNSANGVHSIENILETCERKKLSQQLTTTRKIQCFKPVLSSVQSNAEPCGLPNDKDVSKEISFDYSIESGVQKKRTKNNEINTFTGK